jgi:hypothetical protein
MLNALLTAPVDPGFALQSVREDVAARWHQNHSPILLIVVAIAVIIGLGIVAYLTVQCLRRGYIGFGGVVSISKGWTNWTVRFTCI